MARRVNEKIRGREKRKRKKIILIGTEGNNRTETKYLENFRRHLSEYSIVFARGNDTDSLGVINNTIYSMNEEELNLKEGDLVYSLIDYDVNVPREKLNKLNIAIEKAQENNIKVLISNPTFEIWYLLHYRYSTKSFNSNEDVIYELKKYIKNYQKNLDVYNRLIDKLPNAIDNAKKLENYHSKQGNTSLGDKCPSSDVYKLMEIVEKDMNKKLNGCC